jgi:general secretion pathway protein A
VREAIRELQWTDYASRTNRLRAGLTLGGETVARLIILPRTRTRANTR